jgi:hypothetical protein
MGENKMFTVRVYGPKHLLRAYSFSYPDEAAAVAGGWAWAARMGKEATRVTAREWS